MSDERPRSYSITFLRHGESVGNAEARWQGQADFTLTEQGRAQAQALAARWQAEGVTFDAILSSPLKRAKETAEIIGAALGLAVESDPIWMERHIGEFAGLTNAEINERYTQPEITTPFDAVSADGEGDWALFLRAGQALHGLLRRPPGRYLVVSHGGLLNQVLRAIVGALPHANGGGPRFGFKNTGFAQVTYHSHVHRWHIESVNDRSHWKETLA